MDNAFETEEYRFSFEQTPYDVLVFVKTIEGRNLTDDDDYVKNIKELFQDIDKWETLVRTVKSFLRDLDIILIDERIEERFPKQQFKI